MNPVEDLASILIRKHGPAARERALDGLLMALAMWRDHEGIALLDATVRELDERDWIELVPDFDPMQYVDRTVRRLLEKEETCLEL